MWHRVSFAFHFCDRLHLIFGKFSLRLFDAPLFYFWHIKQLQYGPRRNNHRHSTQTFDVFRIIG